MKKNKFISAVILTISLFLMIGSAGADLVHVGWVAGSDFYPHLVADTLYDDAQDLVWADFTTNIQDNWHNLSYWADGIAAAYRWDWDQDPLDFLGGWRLPTADEFLHPWSVGLNNSPGLFDSLRQADYWTASINAWPTLLFSMASGESKWADSIYPFGYGMVVRDVVPDFQVADSQVSEPSSLALGFLSLSGFIRCREIFGRG